MKQVVQKPRCTGCSGPRLFSDNTRSRKSRLCVFSVLKEDPPSQVSSAENAHKQLELVEQQLNRLLAPSLTNNERPPPQDLLPERDQVQTPYACGASQEAKVHCQAAAHSYMLVPSGRVGA